MLFFRPKNVIFYAKICSKYVKIFPKYVKISSSKLPQNEPIWHKYRKFCDFFQKNSQILQISPKKLQSLSKSFKNSQHLAKMPKCANILEKLQNLINRPKFSKNFKIGIFLQNHQIILWSDKSNWLALDLC